MNAPQTAASATRGHANAAEVVVVAGLDAKQVEAAWTLHQAFAAEQDQVADGQAWGAEVDALIRVGAYNVAVAWDGDKPVGVVEMHLAYDALSKTRIAWGKRAYVLPEYRQADIFKTIFDAGVRMSDALMVDVQRAIADTDWHGAVMKKFYESQGFKVVGYVMERVL